MLLIAHGSSRVSGAQQIGHVSRLAEKSIFTEVAAAFLKGEPSLAPTLAAFKSKRICAVPLLMSDGIIAATMRREIAAVKGACDVVEGRPIGLSPFLSRLIARRVMSICLAHDLPTKSVNVVLAGHGTRADPASRNAAHAHATRLSAGSQFAAIASAFLEEPPSLEAAFAALSGDVVVVGLFAGGGTHAERDLPAQIETARPRRGGALLYAGAIGDDPGVADLIIEEARLAIAAEAG